MDKPIKRYASPPEAQQEVDEVSEGEQVKPVPMPAPVGVGVKVGVETFRGMSPDEGHDALDDKNQASWNGNIPKSLKQRF